MRHSAPAWTIGPLLVALAAPTAAQTVETDELSAVAFRPAPGTGGYLMLEGVEIGRHAELPIALVADYAYRPLYVRTFCEDPDIECDEEIDRVAVVRHLVAFHLSAALPIERRLELALSLPIVHSAGDGWTFRDPRSTVRVPGGAATGLGDPLLSLRARLLGGAEEGLGLATVIYGTLPLGQRVVEDRHVGDASFDVGGHLVGEAFEEGLRGAVTLGAVYRPERTLTSVTVGPTLTYGAAVEWRAHELASVLGEAQGGLGLGEATPQLEVRAGGRLRLGSIELTAGAGIGVVRGPGVPWARLLAGLRWMPIPEPDRDGDGIVDVLDECPGVPEDRDGFEDEDGCPDHDNDGDGIPDDRDRCPDDPEDRDGFEDEDGCPDPDNDGDGVPDGYDSCPNDPEDHDGHRDDDGCPDLDADDGGRPDAQDPCAGTPGVDCPGPLPAGPEGGGGPGPAPDAPADPEAPAPGPAPEAPHPPPAADPPPAPGDGIDWAPP